MHVLTEWTAGYPHGSWSRDTVATVPLERRLATPHLETGGEPGRLGPCPDQRGAWDRHRPPGGALVTVGAAGLNRAAARRVWEGPALPPVPLGPTACPYPDSGLWPPEARADLPAVLRRPGHAPLGPSGDCSSSNLHGRAVKPQSHADPAVAAGKGQGGPQGGPQEGPPLTRRDHRQLTGERALSRSGGF